MIGLKNKKPNFSWDFVKPSSFIENPEKSFHLNCVKVLMRRLIPQGL